MTELYLIAHKARGEATFDVAERLDCPKCHPGYDIPATFTCDECDDVGYWWILSTCGYRAHPYWYKQISRISCEGWFAVYDDPWRDIPPMPETALDCFPINSPSHKSLPDRSNDLLARLNLIPKGPALRRIK